MNNSTSWFKQCAEDNYIDILYGPNKNVGNISKIAKGENLRVFSSQKISDQSNFFVLENISLLKTFLYDFIVIESRLNPNCNSYISISQTFDIPIIFIEDVASYMKLNGRMQKVLNSVNCFASLFLNQEDYGHWTTSIERQNMSFLLDDSDEEYLYKLCTTLMKAK